MYSRDQINKMYEILGKQIDISDELFDEAVKEYQRLGKWLDEQTPEYNLSVYPQGSFALGTVVKPITDQDDYDIDLVCEFAEDYGLSAAALKVQVVKPLLQRYRRISGELKEKRRCWHVEYEDIPNFHMDVIPAIDQWRIIEITDYHKEAKSYDYIGSDPVGFVNWFFTRCKKMTDSMYDTYLKNNNLRVESGDVDRIKRYKFKTPLQRAVQILKRHRDIMYENKPSDIKPVSIIITTMAGELYQDQDNVLDALTTILEGAEAYISEKNTLSGYKILNPSYSGENFADKWNEHPERAKEFVTWVRHAKKDLISSELEMMMRQEMARHLNSIFGVSVGTKVFVEIAKADSTAIKSGDLRVDTKSGSLSTNGTLAVPPNHHHGN